TKSTPTTTRRRSSTSRPTGSSSPTSGRSRPRKLSSSRTAGSEGLASLAGLLEGALRSDRSWEPASDAASHWLLRTVPGLPSRMAVLRTHAPQSTVVNRRTRNTLPPYSADGEALVVGGGSVRPGPSGRVVRRDPHRCRGGAGLRSRGRGCVDQLLYGERRRLAADLRVRQRIPRQVNGQRVTGLRDRNPRSGAPRRAVVRVERDAPRHRGDRGGD